MDAEHESLAKEERVILVEYVEGGKRNKCLKPVIIGNQSVNDLSRFLVQETQNLEIGLAHLKAREQIFQTKKKSHGQIRGERELHDGLRGIRDEQIKTISRLNVLKGDSIQPIKVFRERGNIEKWELTDFPDRDNYRWWKFVQKNDLLLSVAEIEHDYPRSVEFLFDVYTLSTKSKMGNPEMREYTESSYRELLESYKRLPEDQIKKMAPLMQKIEESIVKS